MDQTQEAFARQTLGVSPVAVARYETNRVPTAAVLRRLADIARQNQRLDLVKVFEHDASLNWEGTSEAVQQMAQRTEYSRMLSRQLNELFSRAIKRESYWLATFAALRPVLDDLLAAESKNNPSMAAKISELRSSLAASDSSQLADFYARAVLDDQSLGADVRRIVELLLLEAHMKMLAAINTIAGFKPEDWKRLLAKLPQPVGEAK